MRVRHWLLSTVALALALVLSGCTEEPKPIFPDPTTPTPGASASSSEPAPEPESAEDFIRRWTATTVEMETTGKTKAYLAMAEETCESCNDHAKSVKSVYASGGYAENDGLEVVRIRQPVKSVNEFRVVRRAGETRVYDASGEVQQTFSGGMEKLSVFLTQTDEGQWLVQESLSR